MDVRFYLDPETDEPHIYNHGIADEEVAEALRRSGEDRPRGGMVAASLSVGRLPAGTCELSTCRTPSWIAFS
jgi:hypothetical protein